MSATSGLPVRSSAPRHSWSRFPGAAIGVGGRARDEDLILRAISATAGLGAYDANPTVGIYEWKAEATSTADVRREAAHDSRVMRTSTCSSCVPAPA